MRVADQIEHQFYAQLPVGTLSRLRNFLASFLRVDRNRKVVVVISQFLQTYQKQLRHVNTMVHCSTQHGLYEAMRRFRLSMPCVRPDLCRHCWAHNTHHDKFVFYMHLLCFYIYSPRSARNKGRTTSCAGLCMLGRRVPSMVGWMLVTIVCVTHMRQVGC